MSKLILYIAITEDGFIADSNGKIKHLDAFGNNELLANDYPNFISSIEYQIMGSRTFIQVRDELSPGFWPHEDLITFVYSNDLKINSHNIKTTNLNPEALIKEIKQVSDKDIFLVGGADIIKQFQTKNIIDEYIIFWLPIKLKEGIFLFKEEDLDNLKLIKSEQLKNVIKKTYTK